MDKKDALVGARVRSLVEFSGVPKGTEGMIDEDCGEDIMVAWDLPGNPLPTGYRHEGKPTFVKPLRDGFGKRRELRFLELVTHADGRAAATRGKADDAMENNHPQDEQGKEKKQ